MIGGYYPGQAYPGRTGSTNFNLSLTISSSLHGQSTDNIILSQQHYLDTDSITHDQTMDGAITIIENRLLSINGVLHDQTTTNATLIQNSILELLNALHGQSIDNTSLIQNHLLILADLIHDQNLEELYLLADLVIANASHGQAVDHIIIHIKVRPQVMDVQIENEMSSSFDATQAPISEIESTPFNAINIMNNIPENSVEGQSPIAVDINP